MGNNGKQWWRLNPASDEPEKQCRRTPPELFRQLHGIFRFTIDACADHDNALLPRYWTAEQDCRRQNWTGERVFCNPPFNAAGGGIVAKAREAAFALFILPEWTTSNKSFRSHWPTVIAYPQKRINFGARPGVKSPGPNFGCFFALYGPVSAEQIAELERLGYKITHNNKSEITPMTPHTQQSDADILADVDRRAQTVADKVRSVIMRYTPAILIQGPAGHGKSHIIKAALNKYVGVGKWCPYNTYITPAAFVEALFERPAAIHFLDDTQNIFTDPKGIDVLLAACGAPSYQKRIVSWRTKNERTRFEFSGGVVVATNRKIKPGEGAIGGIASRFSPLEWRLSQVELIAVMRKIARAGVHVPIDETTHAISPRDSMLVAEYMISLMLHTHNEYIVNLRSFCERALPEYLQCKLGHSDTPWQEMVAASIHNVPESRSDRIAREQEIALRIDGEGGPHSKKLAKFKAETGHGRDAFYTRLAEAKAVQRPSQKQAHEVGAVRLADAGDWAEVFADPEIIKLMSCQNKSESRKRRAK